MQKRALDENVRRISEMCKDEKVLTLEEAIKWAADIMEHVGDGFDTQAVTLEEFLGIDGSDQNPDDWGYSLYWGYTSRMLNPGKLEYTLNPGKLNRPVLLWSDNSTITMSDAQSELGFTFHEVHASTLKYNARMVEKALQRRYQHLELGHRLWRCPDRAQSSTRRSTARCTRSSSPSRRSSPRCSPTARSRSTSEEPTRIGHIVA